MKMAKASEADIQMAMDLCLAFDALTDRHCPTMPEAVEFLDGSADGSEVFDDENRAQCQRALKHLLEIASRGSLMRVIWGYAVLVDPANKVVNPDSDVLELHPDHVKA